MKQLTGLDASFLFLETESQFGHVSSLSVFARPDVPDYDPLAAWRKQLQERLHLIEPMRRRLREVPFGLDHPFWIEDPDFDLDAHVTRVHVDRPGDDHALDALFARLCRIFKVVICDTGGAPAAGMPHDLMNRVDEIWLVTDASVSAMIA